MDLSRDQHIHIEVVRLQVKALEHLRQVPEKQKKRMKNKKIFLQNKIRIASTSSSVRNLPSRWMTCIWHTTRKGKAHNKFGDVANERDRVLHKTLARVEVQSRGLFQWVPSWACAWWIEENAFDSCRQYGALQEKKMKNSKNHNIKAKQNSKNKQTNHSNSQKNVLHRTN